MPIRVHFRVRITLYTASINLHGQAIKFSPWTAPCKKSLRQPDEIQKHSKKPSLPYTTIAYCFVGPYRSCRDPTKVGFGRQAKEFN